MGEGEKFEQQSFYDDSDFCDQKEIPYVYFEKGVRSRTLDYDGKSWLFTQDPIIVEPKGEVKKDGFQLYRFLCNANPGKRGDEYVRKQVELSKDRYRRYVNAESNCFIKLDPKDGSKDEAIEYLEKHGDWFTEN